MNTPIPSTPIDPPTVSMAFAPNTSPIAGQEGTPVTAGAIRERLQQECEHNVSLRVVDSDNRENSEVHARGELQLGVLIETMRREKYELSIFPPRVVMKTDENGNQLEPIEECIIDVPKGDSTAIMQTLTARYTSYCLSPLTYLSSLH
jgi:GTP-binding protein